jgi:16S rRNA (uracil1498-N3)-methyltransferase
MSRFYVRPEDVNGDEIRVSKEEAHHIIDVMRMLPGDTIVAFDGTGKEYTGKILNTAKDNLRIKIEKTHEIGLENKVYVTLAQALPKRAQMDFIVEKATELGVDEIIPLVTERTIVHLPKEKREKKRKHWQDIAINAAKQCGRLDIPRVLPSIKFSEILEGTKRYDLSILACLHKGTKPIKEMIANFKGKRILVMIGPEGDFTPLEIESARSLGVKLVSFGRLVLRVDTAALFILSVLHYEKSSIQDIRVQGKSV